MNTADICTNFTRPSTELIARAAQFQPAIFADIQGRKGAMHGRIKALSPHLKLAGPAFTVDVRPGDNLMIHAALALAKPGDILVIDGKADQTAALMGAIMMNAAHQLKLGGVVIDGSIRDVIELAELGLPVFSIGSNPNGPTKNIGGRIGHTISCGGVSVAPGDFIIGDADGVVVVEQNLLASLIESAAHKVSAEANRITQIKKGNTAAPWLLDSLIAAGVLKQGQTL